MTRKNHKEKICSSAQRAGQLFCSCTNRQQIHLYELLFKWQVTWNSTVRGRTAPKWKKKGVKRKAGFECRLWTVHQSYQYPHSIQIYDFCGGNYNHLLDFTLQHSWTRPCLSFLLFSSTELFYVLNKCLPRTGCTLMMVEKILMSSHCGTAWN